jgi:hypothetical protein
LAKSGLTDLISLVLKIIFESTLRDFRTSESVDPSLTITKLEINFGSESWAIASLVVRWELTRWTPGAIARAFGSELSAEKKGFVDFTTPASFNFFAISEPSSPFAIFIETFCPGEFFGKSRFDGTSR